MTSRISPIRAPYIAYRFFRQLHETIETVLTYPQGRFG